MHDIRTLLGKVNTIANQNSLSKEYRRFILMTTALFRKDGASIRSTLDGTMNIHHIVQQETQSWISPEDIAASKSGRFDVVDLRHWIEIAKLANIPFVPAREILSLSEAELNAIDRKINAPNFLLRWISKGIEKAFTKSELQQTAEMAKNKEQPTINPETIYQKLFDAMEDVPSSWIIRSNFSGPSTLKTYAGAGVLDEDNASWKLPTSDIEIGPGWVRHGNRRRVDALDKRFVDLFAMGNHPSIHYLARPWITASRRSEGEDPHRRGTMFAGLGSWPCEWRVFVKGGKVTGVAAYYGWIGEISPLAAQRALEAAELAQKLIDTIIAKKLTPRFMDIEIAREQIKQAKKNDQFVHPITMEILDQHPENNIECTLDFIEAKDDDGNHVMTFLEAGPAHTRMGGGHPCAFAGHNSKPETGAFSNCNGVALALMDNIIMADPATWPQGANNGQILTWDEARTLASSN